MSDYAEQKTNQLRLILSDYQSELNAIDVETSKEKARILSAIENEELEIKSLLEQYRQVKRQKEIDGVRSSYENLAQFKQNLVLKIKSESRLGNANESPSNEPLGGSNYERLQLNSAKPQDIDRKPNSFSEPKVAPAPTLIQNTATKFDGEQNSPRQKIEQETELIADPAVKELIQFVDERSASEIVKLYPADISQVVSNFDLSNTTVRDRVLQHYKQQDPDIYKSLVKIYQKPDLIELNNIPNLDSLSSADRKYHDFLQANYPLSLPFFWFLINREPNSIRYVVMEFAIDHIIHTNTLSNDPHRRDLSLKLFELLDMNNEAPLNEFLRDLFVCFHPQRVSQKTNSRNKYFDYMDSLITTQSTLQYSDALLMWNYMKKSGYHAVSSADFDLNIPVVDDFNNNGSKSLAPESDREIL